MGPRGEQVTRLADGACAARFSCVGCDALTRLSRGPTVSLDPDMEIRALEAADIAATAALLAKAMDDDPAYRFLFPREQERRAGLEDFFRRNLRTHLPYRCTYVGVVEANVVATVTMRPPGGVPISMWTLIRRGLLPFALTHGHRAVQRLLTLKDTYDAIETRVARGELHWFVHMMAVEPSEHGKGLGSRLLRIVLDATAGKVPPAAAAPAILTTHSQRNVVFYQRSAFEVDRVEEVSLMGDRSYSVWCMRRQA